MVLAVLWKSRIDWLVHWRVLVPTEFKPSPNSSDTEVKNIFVEYVYCIFMEYVY